MDTRKFRSLLEVYRENPAGVREGIERDARRARAEGIWTFFQRIFT
jgi:hypothetical protein